MCVIKMLLIMLLNLRTSLKRCCDGRLVGGGFQFMGARGVRVVIRPTGKLQTQIRQGGGVEKVSRGWSKRRRELIKIRDRVGPTYPPKQTQTLAPDTSL